MDWLPVDTQRKITSLARQNDAVTSFWRNNDVIIVSCVRWTCGKKNNNLQRPQNSFR